MLIQNFGVTNEEHYGTQMYVMVFSEVVNSDSLFRHCTLCYALLLAEKVLTGFSTKLRMFSNAWRWPHASARWPDWLISLPASLVTA